MSVFSDGHCALSAVCFAALCWSTCSSTVSAQETDFEAANTITISRTAERQAGQRMAIRVLSHGDSSRQQRGISVDELPWNDLNPSAREKSKAVLENLSLFRRLPTVAMRSDDRAYHYFVDNPDVAVGLWRAMGISKVQLERTGPLSFTTDTTDGTTGTIDVLHRTPTSCLIYCTGEFQSPALVKPIRADSLMHLQPVFTHEGQVVHKFDLFVAFPSQTVETIARVISPVSNRIADRNFEEISLFVEMMNRGMSLQPGWVEQIALRMEGVDATAADELLNVTAAVYVDAQRQQARENGQTVSLEVPAPTE